MIRQTFKFKLKISPRIETSLYKFAGATRFVWNKMLAWNLNLLNNGYRVMRYEEMSFWLTLWKQSEEYSFLKEAPAQVLQQKLKALDKAFRDGFDKKQIFKRIPVFKKKGSSDSFRYPQGFKIEQGNERLFFPKIGWVRYRGHRDIIGQAKNITVSRSGNDWHASIQTEQHVEKPQHNSHTSVGLDRGIANFAVLSDGTVYKPLNSFRKSENKLALLQRSVSKKVKFSQNWKKAIKKVSRLHTQIANKRKDYLHKVSHNISKNHAIVVVEDLKIKNMSKSAKGMLEENGKNVKAKSGLNKSILDQGWHMFKTFLTYKLERLGGQIVTIPARNTSRKCSVCGNTHGDNRQTQDHFECISCGHQEHADLNAAKNILAAGHAVLACGEEWLHSSMKQEPSFGTICYGSSVLQGGVDVTDLNEIEWKVSGCANYLLREVQECEGVEIYHYDLQLMLFLAYRYYRSVFVEKLFDAEIKVVDGGFIVPIIYTKFVSYGNDAIGKNGRARVLIDRKDAIEEAPVIDGRVVWNRDRVKSLVMVSKMFGGNGYSKFLAYVRKLSREKLIDENFFSDGRIRSLVETGKWV